MKKYKLKKKIQSTNCLWNNIFFLKALKKVVINVNIHQKFTVDNLNCRQLCRGVSGTTDSYIFHKD